MNGPDLALVDTEHILLELMKRYPGYVFIFAKESQVKDGPGTCGLVWHGGSPAQAWGLAKYGERVMEAEAMNECASPFKSNQPVRNIFQDLIDQARKQGEDPDEEEDDDDED